jgi:opacity protein-like surface antigen
MALLVYRARARALTAVVGALCAWPAIAADMPFLPAPEPAPVNQPVEFGSGWYLRGDIGYSNMQIPVVVADFANSLGRNGVATGGIGAGFQFNNWFRADVTLDRSVFRPGGGRPPVWCPSGTVINYAAATANATSPNAGQPAGYLYDPNETCTPVITSNLNRTSPMANAYIDIGNWWGLTPYVGAGVGLSYLQTSAALNYYQNWNGQLWAPNLGVSGVPLGWVTSTYSTVPIVPTPASGPTRTIVATPAATPRVFPWQQLLPNQSLQRKYWQFAWNVMAGVSYDISQNLKLDVHYRFLNAGSFTGLPSFITGAGAVTQSLVSHEVRVGLRLQTD